MHSDVLRWVEYALERAAFAPEGRVLEIGSRDWNGTPRHLFQRARYVGVDLAEGPAVDLVADGADLRSHFRAGEFDAVLCLEVLEHAPRKREILGEMLRVLRPGGLGVVTAGAPGRPRHDGGTEIYENLEPRLLLDAVRGLPEWAIEVGPNEAGFPDVRAWFKR